MFNTIIVFPFTNALLLIYTWVGNNFTLALILLTVGVRVLMIPLTLKQQKSQVRMQELQPKIKEIQDKYKKQPEKMQAELKKIGYNPSAMLGGCLPTLVQFPVLIGMYQSILRGIPATPLQMMNLHNAIYPEWFPDLANLIPVQAQLFWMDLSQPDRLYLDFLPWGIPILPVFVVLTTFLQQKMMTPPSMGDGKDQAAQMQRSMMTMMPLMFGFFALQFASGLSIYFITANIVTILQFAILNRERLEWKDTSIFGLFQIPFPTFSPATAAATSGSARNTKKLPANNPSSSEEPKEKKTTATPASKGKRRRKHKQQLRARNAKAGGKK